MRRFVRAPVWVIGAVLFASGIFVGRVGVAGAADAPGMTAMVIHTTPMGAADLPPAAAGSPLQTKIVATADGATVQVQLGTVGKHFHANANEVQYIVQGQGKFWLGDSYKDVGPGDLIIIPKGTAHGGTTTAFKAIAFKTPPQAHDDIHPVP
jgi:mannose-6-phosphate isomerase-like protein (cupin superfamily)